MVDDWVQALRELLATEFTIREHARDIEDGRTARRVFHHELGRVAEVLFERRSHTFRHVAIEPLKYHQEFVHDKGLLLGTREIVFEEVETEWAREIGGVEVDDVLVPLGRYSREDVENVGTVRIDEAAAVSIFNILDNHRLHEPGLAGARLTDNVEMAQAIFGVEVHARLSSAIYISTEKRT